MRGKIIGHGANTRYEIDGNQVSKQEFDEVFPDKEEMGGDGSGLIAWKRPILSDALAVHPLDVAEAVEDSKKKGVPTEFLPDGRAILTDRSHRKRYLKAYGFRDNQGGYGD